MLHLIPFLYSLFSLHTHYRPFVALKSIHQQRLFCNRLLSLSLKLLNCRHFCTMRPAVASYSEWSVGQFTTQPWFRSWWHWRLNSWTFSRMVHGKVVICILGSTYWQQASTLPILLGAWGSSWDDALRKFITMSISSQNHVLDFKKIMKCVFLQIT